MNIQIIIHCNVSKCPHTHLCAFFFFQGDTILETGEVVPDLPEAGGHGHH